jgi:hypothetical protein
MKRKRDFEIMVESSTTTRLKPDLEITIGQGEEQATKMYHSGYMAMISAYCDAAVSNGMIESETKKLAFEDIHPDTWESMMYYAEPFNRTEPDLEDAMQLYPLYQLYGFEQGTRLCEKQISTVFKQGSQHSLEKMVELYAYVSEHNIVEPKADGTTSFVALLGNAQDRCYLTSGMISKLAPTIATEDVLWQAVTKIFEDKMPKGSREDIVAEKCFPEMLSSRMSLLKISVPRVSGPAFGDGGFGLFGAARAGAPLSFREALAPAALENDAPVVHHNHVGLHF